MLIESENNINNNNNNNNSIWLIVYDLYESASIEKLKTFIIYYQLGITIIVNYEINFEILCGILHSCNL